MWVQNGLVGFEKMLHTEKTKYSVHYDSFVLGGTSNNK